jgi:hypothetical protein
MPSHIYIESISDSTAVAVRTVVEGKCGALLVMSADTDDTAHWSCDLFFAKEDARRHMKLQLICPGDFKAPKHTVEDNEDVAAQLAAHLAQFEPEVPMEFVAALNDQELWDELIRPRRLAFAYRDERLARVQALRAAAEYDTFAAF